MNKFKRASDVIIVDTSGRHKIEDELISEMGKISALRVISRQSVLQYKHSDKSLPDIAQELDVKAILEASVLLINERVRISARLYDAMKDKQLFNEKYESPFSDLMILQGELAQNIAEEIKIKLTIQEQERLSTAHQVNPEAHEAYLRGRHFWNKMSLESVDKSIEYFNKAIERDPNYALAYLGLADAYILIPQIKALPAEEFMPKAKAAAKKAIALDDTIAEAHATLGLLHFSFEWDFVSAERELKKALQLNPNSSKAHLWYGQFLNVMNQPSEALEERKIAQRLDPLSSFSIVNAAAGFYYCRMYDEALEELKKVSEIDPNYWVTYQLRGGIYAQKGMYENAISEFQKRTFQ